MRVFILAGLALLLALMAPGTAQAEIIEVPCAPSATIYLGQAIEQANASPGPDTIRLEGDCTYGLTTIYDTNEGFNALPIITDALTIEGNGARLERMGNANVRYRLLEVAQTGALTLEDLTLANGYADEPAVEGARGGAILSWGDLSLRNVTVTGNRAQAFGGGIYVFDAHVAITDSRFENNQATSPDWLSAGGGLLVELGSVVLNNVSFSGNLADNYGGGAVLAETTNAITDSLFENNEVTNVEQGSSGGGLVIFEGEATIYASEFIGNESIPYVGGAIYANEADIAVSGAHFEGNVADEGGAIYAERTRITVAGSTFLDNVAVTNAEALFLMMQPDTTSLVFNNLLVGNRSNLSSAALYVELPEGDSGTTRAHIYHNTLADPQNGFGTAIRVQSGNVRVANNIIANYQIGLVNRSGEVYAGHNLYQIDDADNAQRGTISPLGNGSIYVNDPQFVDRADGDYHLLGTSDAVDNGYDAGRNADIEGTERPQGEGYDIGAYEYIAQNTPPVAVGDNYLTPQDTVLNVAAPGVLDNDEDADGDDLTAELGASPNHGEVILNDDGSFTYTPDAGYVGADGFTYRAYDGQDDSNAATVTIQVQAVNEAPIAGDDAYATLQDTVLNIGAPGVLDNDEDGDGDNLTAILESSADHGDVTFNADGSFSYAPDGGYNGEDSFTYRASDGEDESNVATVTITVEEPNINVPPVAVGDIYQTLEDTLLTVPARGVLGNDGDANGDALTAVLVSGPDHGQLALQPDGSFSYTPDGGYDGVDSFTYAAHDGQASSNVATVTIEVQHVNAPPVAVNDAYATPQDTALTLPAPGVLDNDEDAEGDDLVAELVSAPSHGQVDLNAEGSFIYTPDAGYVGVDSFTYTAHDGRDVSDNAATVTITVVEANANVAPTALGDSFETSANTTLNVFAPGVLGNDADANGDPLTAQLVSGPDHGQLTLNADGSFSYTPDSDYTGEDSFVYQAYDGISPSGDVTVHIEVQALEQAPISVFLPLITR